MTAFSIPLIAAALTLAPMAASAQSSLPSAKLHLTPSRQIQPMARASGPSRALTAIVAPARASKALSGATPREASLHRFEVMAKPEWSDDQGFRVSATRLAFKSRF
jgi:hypothetical protein